MPGGRGCPRRSAASLAALPYPLKNIACIPTLLRTLAHPAIVPAVRNQGDGFMWQDASTLPPEGVVVDVWVEEDDPQRVSYRLAHCYNSDGIWWGRSDEGRRMIVEGVTHWMEIPAAPAG